METRAVRSDTLIPLGGDEYKDMEALETLCAPVAAKRYTPTTTPPPSAINVVVRE